jgi:hypothetical protein
VVVLVVVVVAVVAVMLLCCSFRPTGVCICCMLLIMQMLYEYLSRCACLQSEGGLKQMCRPTKSGVKLRLY